MAGSLTKTDIDKLRRLYPRHARIDTLVETGTFRGETIRNLKRSFSELHTIELSREYYEAACRNEADPRIRFYCGDSVRVLQDLLPTLKKPVLFFLDAHYCQRGTARGNEDVPLRKELELIIQRGFPDLIVIDDVRLFGTHRSEDWSDITRRSILRLIRTRIPWWRRYWGEYRIRNDRMIIPF
jgi:hypothetical protein